MMQKVSLKLLGSFRKLPYLISEKVVEGNGCAENASLSPSGNENTLTIRTAERQPKRLRTFCVTRWRSNINTKRRSSLAAPALGRLWLIVSRKFSHL